LHMESRPDAWRGIDPDLATLHFRGLLYHGESDAGARVVVLAVQPLEYVEDAGVVFGGNADAVVGDADHDLPVIVLPALHRYLCGDAGFAVGQGIVNEVGEY